MSVLELIIAVFVATILLVAALNWVISANRTVSISTAKAVNNSAAQNVVDDLDASLRFASGLWISSDGSTTSNAGNTLYVQDGSATNPPQTCTAWQFTGTTLVRENAHGSSVVATGVTPQTGGAFRAAASPYEGLASVTFTVMQAASRLDSTGTTVTATLSASNDSQTVGTGTVCSLT